MNCKEKHHPNLPANFENSYSTKDLSLVITPLCIRGLLYQEQDQDKRKTHASKYRKAGSCRVRQQNSVIFSMDRARNKAQWDREISNVGMWNMEYISLKERPSPVPTPESQIHRREQTRREGRKKVPLKSTYPEPHIPHFIPSPSPHFQHRVKKVESTIPNKLTRKPSQNLRATYTYNPTRPHQFQFLQSTI